MKFRLCMSFILILVIVGCLGAVIFLIPVMVMPSIIEDRVYYDPVPFRCKVQKYTVVIRELQKCKMFQTCNQGCGKITENCTQFFVQYARKNSWGSGNSSVPISNTIKPAEVEADNNVPLKINHRACGYAPEVNCNVFEQKLKAMGSRPFKCYKNLSRREVVVKYLLIEPPYPVWLAIGLPCVLLIIALGACFLLTAKLCRKTGSQNVAGIDYETSRKCAFED